MRSFSTRQCQDELQLRERTAPAGNHAEALAGYNRALAIQPNFLQAIHNRGNALFELQRFDESLADYDRTLAANPRYAMAWSNRANALLQLKRYEEALAACDRGMEIDPRHIASLSVRANVLFELRCFAEAAEAYAGLLAIDPAYPYALGRTFYCRLLCCDWTDYDRTTALVASKVAAGERVAPPFMFLNMTDSPEQSMQCARTFSRDRHPASAEPLWRGERYRHSKIRLGYLSADFRNHPMAYLMVGLFERHDRSRFETTAFSFGPDRRDAFRKRLEASFDRFIDVRTKRDRELAQLVREHEIDVAVDLIGYTNNGRPGILAFRPAPIQVNYIGFAGTLGADYIDYIIADRFIIPEESRRFYTEHVAYLPDTYWPTDSTRNIVEVTPTRSELGLPDTGFVFCCFNQSHKIAPSIFDIWMRLLRQVEGSLLQAVGLPELITHNLADYQALALKLACDPRMLTWVRAKLDGNRRNSPLFDTDRFRRHIESAYWTMWERHERGAPPDGFAVAAIED